MKSDQDTPRKPPHQKQTAFVLQVNVLWPAVPFAKLFTTEFARISGEGIEAGKAFYDERECEMGDDFIDFILSDLDSLNLAGNHKYYAFEQKDESAKLKRAIDVIFRVNHLFRTFVRPQLYWNMLTFKQMNVIFHCKRV